MYKIDGPGATSDNRFTSGNSAEGILATEVTADFMNTLMDEIANVVVGASISLDKEDNGQLFEAIVQLIDDSATTFGDQPQRTFFAGPSTGSDAPPAFRQLTVEDLPIVLPAGMVAPFVGTSAPTGWLMCDGAAVNRATYSSLFAVMGTAHGSGDGSTTFNLPDYRGRFLRGVDGTAGRDPDKASRTAMSSGGATGNAVGSVQSDQIKSHTHTYDMAASAQGGNPSAIEGSVGSYTGKGAAIDATGGNETRPLNAYVNYIIKT
ncbi:phage tail protein [Jiella pelagia]|uniref:Phage tail protein n=1 Tax=Jiella pelagia TaxID=2986949 RepID=A0ABY7C048_9HYPH|nr:phage tail protein [Jiella pelagia]WAP69032.1 phage tail protein [Jiella pelagia]